MSLPIIFVRYAPGACGTVLLTLLSTAPQIVCWDPKLESIKCSDEFDRCFLDWFKQKFTTDLENHLKNEPHHPYKIDFFSAKHLRGDDIDTSEFIKQLIMRDDRLLLKNIDQDKKTILRLNKSVVPKFAYGAPIINIFVDEQSKKWLHRTRWIKLFGQSGDSFILKEEHPDFLKAKNYNLNFKNTYQVQDSHVEFHKKYVINDSTVQVFQDKKLITSHSSNFQCQQHWIDLSTILDPQQAITAIQQLANQLGIDINKKLLNECYWHYYKTNIEPLLGKV